ncbi:MAG: RHS repeat-associated core domain [Algoriphagus marincola HL-49]|uniref:RHS repeat-associated core domain n=1 Tax=Algoriphagus marincola HL-49 TaxID=1305737 RepID=A0A0P7Y454_9BACT|nr:MAG: RHS repeat-associated core domain [Algoriphagus marincola HL-49]
MFAGGHTLINRNGNISKVEWRGKDDVKRTYTFAYDKGQRLVSAAYTTPGESGRYTVNNMTYDHNGNLKTLNRNNLRSGTSYGLVDVLTYDYPGNGNKLTQVTDSYTSTTYQSKDFKERDGTPYTYDTNGNLTQNLDKEINSITYNHLNLPKVITFTGSNRRIEYQYNAEGMKVQQINRDGSTVTTLNYIGEFVLEGSAMSYILHEEGRAAFESGAFQYEFFIKDHLGNVRQVVRAPVSAFRIATMEPEKAAEEEELFQNIKETRQGAGEHNKTPGGYATAWLNAERGRILGPSRSQEVQEGDSIELNVFGKYVDPKKIRLSPATFARTGLDQKIIRTLGEYGQNLAAAPNELAIANVIALVITELQQKPAPEAYMGYALYDSDSVLYEQGKVVLSKKARNKHEELIQKLAIKKDGYIETFLVNETSENVWFDQFRIQSTGPLIVQETHYDPWGVELSGLGYQYGGIKVNPYLYQGKEFENIHGFNLYDFHARGYDATIGRTWQQDPMSEMFYSLSPYSWTANNPIRFTDPTGMVIEDGSKKEWEKQKRYVQNRMDKLQGRIDKLNAKAADKGWSAEKLASKVGNLSERISSLNGSLATMGTLESSVQVYSLSRAASGNKGGVSLNTGTNVIDIRYGNTANFVHEITHAGQFETGDIAFSSTGQTLGQDIQDEIAGYKAQFAYDPSSVSGLSSTAGVANSFGGITAKWVQGIRESDGNLPYAPGGTANTGVAPVNINSTRDGLIRAYPHQAGKLRGMPANYSLKSIPGVYYKKR